MGKNNHEAQLVSDIASFTNDPLGFVLYAFPWGKNELQDYKGPENWQANFLRGINKDNLKDAIRCATTSGHGTGKSCIVSWLILWAMSTFEDTRGVITANTENQLKTKTWSELAKWHRLAINSHWFNYSATSLYSVDPKREKTWRIDAIPWSERNVEAFAGLHNKGKRILVIFDEASAIPDVIWETTEGAMSDKNTQKIWAVFGNPTRSTGRFRECFRNLKHRWTNFHVNSETVSITDKSLINTWKEDYGPTSDFYKVRVLGEFPSQSDVQFISSEYVDTARKKVMTEEMVKYAPCIIGVDPAWTGSDETVIAMRKGNYSTILAKYNKLGDDMLMANYINNFASKHSADMVFIDLGYGTGIYSALRQIGRESCLVSFASASSDIQYLNKRAEMWGKMRDWLKEGGRLDDDSVLCDELTGPEYIVKMNGKIQLESKDDMKRRGIPSPNRADALALTFAYPVEKKKLVVHNDRKEEYDPLSY